MRSDLIPCGSRWQPTRGRVLLPLAVGHGRRDGVALILRRERAGEVGGGAGGHLGDGTLQPRDFIADGALLLQDLVHVTRPQVGLAAPASYKVGHLVQPANPKGAPLLDRRQTLFVARLHIGTRPQEHVGDAAALRTVQRRAAIRVALVDLGAAREKRRHDLQVVRRHTLVDQARAREVGTRVEAGLDLLQVAVVDRGEQVLHKLRRRRHDGLAAQPARDEPASSRWSRERHASEG